MYMYITLSKPIRGTPSMPALKLVSGIIQTDKRYKMINVCAYIYVCI